MVAVVISIEALETVELHLLITTGIVLNVTTPIFHSVENVTDVASHVLEAVETEETVAVEISIEVLEMVVAETVAVEISTEVIEEEMTQMMATGIVLSVIILTSLEELNVTDVASLEVLAAVVEMAAVEISIEAPETVVAETVVEEISIEAPETEAAEMVAVEISIETPEAVAAETVVVEREENSLAVMMTELSQKRIISANQRVKEQDTPTITHQNQLFHVNLIEIVMIK
jgi:hypothetical protein